MFQRGPDDDWKDNFRLRLKASRDRLGMSQTDLARALRVSKPAVQNWEYGSCLPTLKAIIQIGQLPGMDLHYLLTGQQLSREIKAHGEQASLDD